MAAAENVVDPELVLFDQLIEGRTARCACGHESPSSRKLAFFEYRGEGTTSAEKCVCGYAECAHDPEYMKTLTPRRDGTPYPTIVERGHCKTGFQARGDVGFDSFYCGHGGWD